MICSEYNISPTNNLVENLSKLINFYKKNKDNLFINVAFFVADFHFKYLRENNLINNDKIFEIKNYIFDNLNNFMLYNINQNSFINAISENKR